MNVGKLVRLNRIFSHPSGRLCSVAIDHFIGYSRGLPGGLRNVGSTLAAIVAGRPDAVTMHKGVAAHAWAPYAGCVPLILQSTTARPDDTACEQVATVEEAIRLGADALAVTAFVCGSSDAAHLRYVADCVRDAALYELPVICHAYPRGPSDIAKVSYEPGDVAWAVRCAVEVGADVVKTPYCGSVEAFAEIVAACPVPLVAAGGPKCDTIESALGMIGEVVQSGARGATIGRNIWSFPHVTAAIMAFKAVIHDRKSAREAMQQTGL
ncbi:MAG: class I fructose-bisphosphate aldolase [Anaerolineae bacterium]